MPAIQAFTMIFGASAASGKYGIADASVTTSAAGPQTIDAEYSVVSV